jgi:prephenate dehydrogenase
MSRRNRGVRETAVAMKIVVIGPGALGALLAAFLAESGQEVLLMDHRPERPKCSLPRLLGWRKADGSGW